MKKIYHDKLIRTILIGLVVLWTAVSVRAIPNDPDNAALLYYQGFLSLVDLGEEARDHIAEVARGEIAPDQTTRECINRCTGAIQFAEAAAEVPACNWGVRYSQGFDCLLPQMAQARYLTFVLIADARLRASDGNTRGAFERCLMTVQFAHHVGDDTIISYLVSLSVRTLAYKCMRDVLSQAAGDEELLEWFSTELVTSEAGNPSPVKPLKIEMEIVTDLMQMENIEELAGILADSSLGALTGSNKKKIAEIVKAVDEKILEQARQIYTERMNSVLIVLSTPMSYEQADAQLKQLSEGFDPNDPAEAGAGAFIPAFSKIYAQQTMRRTTFNALVAAIEIYLRRIQIGQWPDEIPAGLPKDLFSGRDFEYEKNDDGFILRCPGRDSDIYAFQFKVKK